MIFEQKNNSQDILQSEEFETSSLGVHVSKNGISFCIHPAHQDVSISYVQTEKGSFTKEEILNHVKEFDKLLTQKNIVILATTFSFPGPITKDSVEIPNWWATGDNHFKRSDFNGLALANGQVNFINEIQSLGHGLISTDEFYGLEDDFVSLWKPPAMDVMPTLYPLYFSSETATVIQVAFGLGSAFIVPIDSPDSYRVIASEWGHSIVQLCGPDEPGYKDELSLINFIASKKGTDVEWEDICSARGLSNCYEYEMKVAQVQPEPGKQINPLREIENDSSNPIAQKALSTHFKFLMRFARMCAISFTCKSVFITYSVFQGGTQSLQHHIAMCRDEFMHFTKNEWVSNVSVFVQTSDRNISAMGVMYHAFLGLFRSNKDWALNEGYD
ncbi:Glucokinase 1 [Histomonas meleagridis]|uniref:Glucokinase 1 n=1 Tax=Histomonas meleagridis TaxID=135588 RepID=UPI003559530F|nr:Glucokinase 1 [Histomonas meleagridis]KAH0798847.1 Glucokinase 1 [Histomonas meleagridis]